MAEGCGHNDHQATTRHSRRSVSWATEHAQRRQFTMGALEHCGIEDENWRFPSLAADANQSAL
jgi:hypothetical protein